MPFLEPTRILRQFGLTENMRIGDFGSGAGHFAIPAALITGRGGRVYAVDLRGRPLSRLVNIASREYGISNLKPIKANFEYPEESGIRNKTLDAAFLINTLFQLVDKLSAVEEIKRTIKPGGKIVVVDWERSFEDTEGREDKLVKQNEARALFEGEGFEYMKDVNAGDYHYGMIFYL